MIMAFAPHRCQIRKVYIRESLPNMTNAPDILRVALAQLNPTLGDIDGNLALAKRAIEEAKVQKAENYFIF